MVVFRPGRRPPALALTAVLAMTAAGCGSGAERAATPTPEPQVVGEDGLPPIDEETPLPDPLPNVAARVDGEDVPMRNVVLLAESRLKRGEIPLRRRIYAYRQALHEIIARELLFQEAVERGIEPDQATLQQAYDEARSGHRDDAAWTQFLAQQGLNEKGFRAELRVQHTINALVSRLLEGRDFDVSDEEARRFYEENPERFQTGEQVRASHIQLRMPEGATAEQIDEIEARLQEIRTRIVDEGADFAELAEQHSEDPGSAPRGGQLQLFHRGQMPKQLEEVAFSLDPGDVSEVFRTPYGVHILELHGLVASETQPFEKVRDGLKQALQQRARQRAIQQHVAKLRSEARIETFL